ncbi:creatininase family protein [Wenzhouxiangella marina]|uniref:Creatininase n=1 Tax=Wenzhouxiangella marina TaxID=1579979 RepID=A0A0K0Y088_9GAMM|nr:creatininase family protein [Wenzhouxiangella marina]AKS43302.1 Creatininase [Wenzhouxiangella marina]MBB6087007.1 creatinine amidohydrolase [Wenzhouxiangella marina]
MLSSWSDLTTEEFADLAGEHGLAVLVLGAIEQHGPHLPLDTDLCIGEGLCRAMASHLPERIRALQLPSLAIGASQEHASFPGTLSLPPETAIGVIEAIGERCAASGLQRLMLLNAHGGNHGVMEVAALNLRRRFGMLVVKASYMRLPPPDGLLAARELSEGLHGGQAETAMMLHLDPGRVRQDRMEHFEMRPEVASDDALFGAAGRAAWAWMAEDLNPAGVVGRADLATADLGRRLVEHYGRQLAEVLARAEALPWPPGRDE